MKLGFWSGFASAVFYQAFIQDCVGKEKYLAVVGTVWCDTPAWIWPVLLFVVWGLDLASQWAVRS